jgi:hypothetical protein
MKWVRSSFAQTTYYLTKLLRRLPDAGDSDKSYNDLPLLPPKAELETKAVLRKTIAANKALAELKGAGELIPNSKRADSRHRIARGKTLI